MLEKINWIFIRRRLLIKQSDKIDVHWSTYICNKSNLHGYNRISHRCKIIESTIGRFTYISPKTEIKNTEIGAFCSIGPNVQIGGLGIHPTNRRSTHPAFYSTGMQTTITFATSNEIIERKPCKIGNDVWIGVSSIILDGVTIGDGAIIAAGSIVTQDVPDFSIVGGVPAKHIRHRIPEKEALSIKLDPWWNKSVEELKQLKCTGYFNEEI